MIRHVNDRKSPGTAVLRVSLLRCMWVFGCLTPAVHSQNSRKTPYPQLVPLFKPSLLNCPLLHLKLPSFPPTSQQILKLPNISYNHPKKFFCYFRNTFNLFQETQRYSQICKSPVYYSLYTTCFIH